MMDRFRLFRPGDGFEFWDERTWAGSLTGGEIGIGGDDAAFIVVAAGEIWVRGYRLTAGMYGCVSGDVIGGGEGAEALVAVARNWCAPFIIGGPIEARGRLRYIDGCSDSGLLHPPRQGDPCLNYLYFPKETRQTRHFHPSHRIGLVVEGEGWCHTDDQERAPMKTGDCWLIPQGCWHWFETKDEHMRVVAFHPDSEFGPTDDSHQMLNATLRQTAQEAQSA